MIEFNLEKGLKGIAQTTVNKENSAEMYAKPMPPAFATPMLVSLVDLAATPLGITVTADATLIDVFQNRLTFQVNAFDEVEKVGEGTVERYIIDLDKFNKKMSERKKPREVVF